MIDKNQQIITDKLNSNGNVQIQARTEQDLDQNGNLNKKINLNSISETSSRENLQNKINQEFNGDESVSNDQITRPVISKLNSNQFATPRSGMRTIDKIKEQDSRSHKLSEDDYDVTQVNRKPKLTTKLNQSSVEITDDENDSKDDKSATPPLSTQMNDLDQAQRTQPHSKQLSKEQLQRLENEQLISNFKKYEINYNILKQMLDEGYTWDDTAYPTISLSKNTRSGDDSLAFRAFMNHYRQTYFKKYQKISNPKTHKIHEIIYPDLNIGSQMDLNTPISKKINISKNRIQEHSSYFKIDYKGMNSKRQSQDLHQNSGMMKMSSNFSAATFQVKGMIGRKSSHAIDKPLQVPAAIKESDQMADLTMNIVEDSPIQKIADNEFSPIPEIRTPGTPLNIIVLKKDGTNPEQFVQDQALLSMRQSQYNESLNSQSYHDQRDAQTKQYGTGTEKTLVMQSGMSSKQENYNQKLMDYGINAFGAESMHRYLSMYPNHFQMNMQPIGAMSESPFRRFKKQNMKPFKGQLMSQGGKGIMKTKGLLNYKKATNPDLTLHVGGRNSSQMSHVTHDENRGKYHNDSMHAIESQAVKSQRSQESNKNYESKSDHDYGGNIYQKLINQDLDEAISSPKYHHTIFGGAQLTDGSEPRAREQIKSMDKKYTEHASHSLITAALESSQNKEDLSQDKESELKQLKSPKFRPHMMSLQQIKTHADASNSQELNIKKIETEIARNDNTTKSPMTSNVSRQRTPDKITRPTRLDQNQSPSKGSDQSKNFELNINQKNSGLNSSKPPWNNTIVPPLLINSPKNPFYTQHSNLHTTSSRMSNFNVNMITLTGQLNSNQKLSQRDGSPQRQHQEQVNQIQIQEREIQKLKENLESFRKTGMLFNAKNASTSNKILIQSPSDMSSQDAKKGKQVNIVSQFSQKRNTSKEKEKEKPIKRTKASVQKNMQSKQQQNESKLVKGKSSKQRHKEFIETTLKNFTALSKQTKPKPAFDQKKDKQENDNHKQTQNKQTKPKKAGATMTTGLRIQAFNTQELNKFHNQFFDQERVLGISDNEGADMGTGIDEPDRERHERIMSIQTPVSIDKALNDIMNNSKTPHISNEPYPLYDEQMMRSTDQAFKSEINKQDNSTHNQQKVQSLNQTGLGWNNTLGQSRNQTPTHSATLPQHKFIMTKFGAKDFTISNQQSPLRPMQRNSKSVLDEYQTKQGEHSQDANAHYRKTSDDDHLQKTNYIDGFRKNTRTSHEAAVALLSEQIGASTIHNGPSKINKSSNFEEEIKKLQGVTEAGFVLQIKDKDAVINGHSLDNSPALRKRDEGNQINDSTPDIESQQTIVEKTLMMNTMHKSIPQKELQLMADHPLQLGEGNMYPSVGMLGSESPIHITTEQSPSPVKFARIYNKDIEFQISKNPLNQLKITQNKSIYKSKIPGLQHISNMSQRNTILSSTQRQFSLLPTLANKKSAVSQGRETSVNQERATNKAFQQKYSLDQDAYHSNSQFSSFPKEVSQMPFKQNLNLKLRNPRQQGSVTQVGFYKPSSNQLDFAVNQRLLPNPPQPHILKQLRQRRSNLDNYNSTQATLGQINSHALTIQGSSAFPSINDTSKIDVGQTVLSGNRFPSIIPKRPSVYDLISPHSKTLPHSKNPKKSPMALYKQNSPKIRQFYNVISPNRWRQSGELSELDEQPLNSKIV